jgi:hypothetical protein
MAHEVVDGCTDGRSGTVNLTEAIIGNGGTSLIPVAESNDGCPCLTQAGTRPAQGEMRG